MKNALVTICIERQPVSSHQINNGFTVKHELKPVTSDKKMSFLPRVTSYKFHKIKYKLYNVKNFLKDFAFNQLLQKFKI